MLTLAIVAVVVGSIALSYYRSRDAFHPSVIVGPMFLFLYVYLPVRLDSEDGFRNFLTTEQLDFAQLVNFVGIVAFFAGVVLASGKVRWNGSKRQTLRSAEGRFDRERLVRGAIALGLLGIAGFLFNVAEVGGFQAAYGEAYGGGWSQSGWVRESPILAQAGMLLLVLAVKEWNWRWVTMLLLFASPMFIHGLLGARRGPTFIAATSLGVVLYMSRGRRPHITTVLAAGAVLGTLMLFLVSNRDAVYLGSTKTAQRDVTDYLKPSVGNDFIYGSGVVNYYHLTGLYDWGATYAVVLFVRPIPRELWPSKYEDASRWFDIPNLETNLGVDPHAFEHVLGWTAGVGAAPGVVADMWRCFWWFMVLAMFGLGWLYGAAWRRAVVEGQLWLPVYCMLVTLSIYLVMQTVEAILFRSLLTIVPIAILWSLAQRRPDRERPMSNVGKSDSFVVKI